MNAGPPPGWRPLPECSGCGRPTRRATFQRLGGVCTDCHTPGGQGLARLELHEWQTTVQAIRGEENRRAAERIERLRAKRETRGR